MVVDFHTHIFPDALAVRALAKLTGSSGYVPVHDLTAAGLLAFMDAAGVDVSVIQPVVTKATQVKGTNEWAKSVEESSRGRIIAFGGFYPTAPDWRDAVDFVASMGFRGVKFHAEYQSFTLDEPHMLEVYSYCAEKGLIMLHHAGFDPAFAPPFHSTPRAFAEISKALPGATIIAAHLGGHAQWDDVERYICGTDVLIDTSMGFDYYPREQFLRIVKAHGADKILFASDSPWSDAGKEAAVLRSLGLSDGEMEKIFARNAADLLGLSPSGAQ